MSDTDGARDAPPARRRDRLAAAGEVFWVFLRLGLTSFGGPISHLGYFRTALVERRRWLSDAAYAELVALCQVLPGPTSSQVGFSLGFARAGALGAVAAALAFTLPSAVIMVAFGLVGAAVTGSWVGGAMTGLMIVAVAVVAQAVVGMARTLTPDVRRGLIAVGAAVIVLAVPGWTGQLIALAGGVIVGLLVGREAPAQGIDALRLRVRWPWALVSLAGFAVLVAGVPLIAAGTESGVLDLIAAMAPAGGLVFGGGHVVLPLLESSVVASGVVSADSLLAGYGAAQALPGPLFSVSAYLGMVADVGPGGLAGAAIALVAIFAPGYLVLVGAIPLWGFVRSQPWAARAIGGVNAAVVGILGAALVGLVWSGAIGGVPDAVVAIGCFFALTLGRFPAWLVVLAGALAGVVLTWSG